MERRPGHPCHLILVDIAPRRTGSLPQGGHDVNLTRAKPGTGEKFNTHKGSCMSAFLLERKAGCNPAMRRLFKLWGKTSARSQDTSQFSLFGDTRMSAEPIHASLQI